MWILPLLLICVCLLPLVFSGVMLHRIDVQARLRRDSVQIFIVDLFSLVFLVQLPFAVFLRTSDFSNKAAMVVAAIFSVLMVQIWWVTIRAVSKAGIKRTSSRAWISLLVIPMAYVGSFLIIGVGLGINNKLWEEDFRILPMLIVAEIILVVLLFASMFVTNRELKRALVIPLKEAVPKVVSPFDD